MTGMVFHISSSSPTEQRKQIGQKKGATFETKKAKTMKERIQKMAKDFDGSMKDKEVIEILGISRNTYYKYKKELSEYQLTQKMNIENKNCI